MARKKERVEYLSGDSRLLNTLNCYKVANDIDDFPGLDDAVEAFYFAQNDAWMRVGDATGARWARAGLIHHRIRARRRLEEALEMARALVRDAPEPQPLRDMRWRDRMTLAEVLAALGRHEEAIDEARRTVRDAMGVEHPDTHALEAAIRLAAALGDVDSEVAWRTELVSWARSELYPRWQIDQLESELEEARARRASK